MRRILAVSALPAASPEQARLFRGRHGHSPSALLLAGGASVCTHARGDVLRAGRSMVLMGPSGHRAAAVELRRHGSHFTGRMHDGAPANRHLEHPQEVITHARQRARARERGRLLPRCRSPASACRRRRFGGQRRAVPGGDVADLPHDVAIGAGQGRPRHAARRARAPQRGSQTPRRCSCATCRRSATSAPARTPRSCSPCRWTWCKAPAR